MRSRQETTEGPRLLAIDDEPLSADLIVRIAKKCGYEGRAMVETRSLIEVLGRWRPNVITLDLRMPRVNGSDVISLLKIAGFPGQIIIVSGLGPSFLDEARFRAATRTGSRLRAPQISSRQLRQASHSAEPIPATARA